MSAKQPSTPREQLLQRQRWRLLAQISAFAEKPLIVLAIVWLVLLIVDLTAGLSTPLLVLHFVIWGIFIFEFLIRIIIAPDRSVFMRHNWLTAISLLLPALRILRVLQAFRTLRFLRAARFARSATLVRVIGSVNRGMRATRRIVQRRGLGYVIALTIIVTLAGAAGMRFLESPAALQAQGYTDAVRAGAGFHSYGDALWWTAMIMTTMGSEQWPKTTEGRILCWLLALYAFAIFGYITATIASIFIGQDVALARRR